MKRSPLLYRVLFAAIAVLLPALAAEAQREPLKHQPDLADVAQGQYLGNVTSDSKGASRSNVTVTVTRIGHNRVRITSDYPRLPTVEVLLTQAMNTIVNAGGATVFVLDRSKSPLRLDIMA
jgi:hypothetical protein